MRIYYADLEHTFGRDDFTIYAESKEDAYSIISKKKECKKENGKYYHGDPEDDEWDEFFINEFRKYDDVGLIDLPLIT